MYDDDATEFDPNPWGARQRVMPRPTFLAASVPPEPPPAFAAPAAAFAAPAAAIVAMPPALAAPAPVLAARALAATAAAFVAPAFGAPLAFAAPAPAFAAPAFFPPSIALRLPHPRRVLVRYVLPLLAAVLCLGVAYALKPATSSSALAASIGWPVVEPEPAMQIAGTASETAPIALAIADEARIATTTPAKPSAAKPRVARSIASPRGAKARGKASRRVVRIDASITATPLGHLRPSRP